MRKLIIIASIAALAVALTATVANAATTDANGVVTVSKGDIQPRSTKNDSAMPDGQKVTGSNVFTATTTTGYGRTRDVQPSAARHEHTIITEPYHGAAEQGHPNAGT